MNMKQLLRIQLLRLAYHVHNTWSPSGTQSLKDNNIFGKSSPPLTENDFRICIDDTRDADDDNNDDGNDVGGDDVGDGENPREGSGSGDCDDT
ncbi:hypothetical protein K457DRAFT_16807 [Linnemannia elongata AG-77]|uniref:Uncharacterized protein n=1 Tax=Linnemannia elongata AG-77 TaxID=1314771 RepID=A0A197K3Z9_9FUNG|nr:hypothetical protein K457DRAFT_16807 [Linnemannia elongata AG-77]